MTDAERIGDLETQLANYEAERAEAAQVIMQLINANAALVNANRALQRQLLDKRGFTALRVDGRIVVMGRN
mgnify:FL=1